MLIVVVVVIDMNIYYEGLKKEKEGCYFQILSSNSFGLTVSFCKDDDVLDTVEINKADLPQNTKISYYVNEGGQFFEPQDMDSFNANRLSTETVYERGLKDIIGGFKKTYDITVYLTKDNILYVYLCGDTYDPDGTGEKIEKMFMDYLLEHKEYREKREKIRNKRSLLVRLDSNTSLAYLEAQVDFLSYVLFRILEATPELEQQLNEEIDYNAIKERLLDSSILNIKPISACLDEFNIKADIRSQQEKYYESK